ncbi:MAG: 2-oxoacid:acceptor oxidoreductase subunit alpha [Planctomycetes bacterium]|nr:2-oxoacid:acceptor oxidoreductase subunit alpha [Planctomycetota bacterium]
MAAIKRTPGAVPPESVPPAPVPPARVPVEERAQATVRFAGDSGDGMQLAGAQFTSASAHAGNLVFTLPENPTEIRAPAGSLAGVSGFTIHFGAHSTRTAGDRVDVLVAMNPAALKVNHPALQPGGLAIVNADAFAPDEWTKAGYDANPLEDGSLAGVRLAALPINKLSRAAIARIKLSPREAERCRNFFALGMVYWLFDRPTEPTLRWIRAKFAMNPAVLEANSLSLMAGYRFGETNPVVPFRFRVPKANFAPGKYRKLTGNEGLALGLVSAAHRAERPLVFASCPIHPASELMHEMAELKRFDVRCPQAEDEIAALGLALGASFGGAIGVTATSGPGLSLQSEMLGLAVMAELPCVIVDLQRGGPSTGLPGKTEQADLLQALFGRHGECPLVVLAAATPSDCFALAYEAVRLAVRYMTPVILLGDLYLSAAAEAWRIPAVDDLPAIETPHLDANGSAFQPNLRDQRLARPWAIPGVPGFEHRIGGLEKNVETGYVSSDPDNHERMVHLRARKIAQIADELPALAVAGPESGDLLVLGWGSTQGAIQSAVERAQTSDLAVAAAQLRYLNPMPKNTAELLSRYKKVLVPELNGGQLSLLLRARFGVESIGLCKIQGEPFTVGEIEMKIAEILQSKT